MLAIAKKGVEAGFNVLRFNLRNCGGTEDLTPTLYHGGLSEDLQAVVSELVAVDRLSKLCLVGFSLGGNMVLKLAGEYGGNAPAEIVSITAVSPSVDLSASSEAINGRSNWIYEQDFLRRLRGRIRLKQKLYPDLYDDNGLDEILTLREFDDRYTARLHGFEGVDDYYHRASSIRVIEHLRIPTLIIHAEDDPFIPFGPLRDPVFAANPNILMLAPKHGGHVGFVAARAVNNHPVTEDRFWAENRVLEFCRLATSR
jgi:predicted alpha/beta-fold hydrolase